MKTLYLQSEEKDVSKYVVFSGDPGRVRKIIKYMDDVQEIAVNREYYTYTGYYKGVKITVTSTGIGGPSAAIALEEMYECGMEVAVRLGTVMGLKDHLLGKFIIPTGIMRKEATSKTYVDASYPAVGDFELMTCMNKSVSENGFEYENAIMCSMDGFYSEMRESRLSKQMQNDVFEKIQELKKYNISGLDMESGTILTLTNLMGIKGCVVTMTTVLENLKDYLKGEARDKAEEDLIKVVLDGLVIYDKEAK
ncbi:nucleoside phosphorylase [Brassicibacter mesophilus]|uniref:nucleoside phosphorylase n=1 Tax=Brassicibacter mesophilus TaxID=745119 RepID=UPI003D1ED5D1